MRAIGFDTDQDGKQNLAFGSVVQPSKIHFWEHVGFDRYFLEDTALPYSRLYDVGFLDNDSLVDMVGSMTGGCTPIYLYESPTQYSNPTSVVWGDSGFNSIGGGYITDLDQDGLREMLFRFTDTINYRFHTCIYENIGDNQYNKVWEDSIRETAYFINGDFDRDGIIEFVSGNAYGHVYVWECIGDNNYQLVFCDTLPKPANYDIFSAHDMDGNDKSEFLFTSRSLSIGQVHLWLYETVGDNNYEYFLVDSVIGLPVTTKVQFSTCGDIDADGIEEIVWSTYNQWHIYKALDVHNYQRIYSSVWTTHEITVMSIYDLNENGYPEVIESWEENTIPYSHQTIIWEIEGVRLHYPNGNEVLIPGDTCLIRWEKFEPPGADSFSLFFSTDSGRTFDTIVAGISGADTSYLWIVPDIVSDSCKIMIWAYGPPRPGEQVPRGTAWDFSDTLFFIRPVGISENEKVNYGRIQFVIAPNLFTYATTIHLTGISQTTGPPMISIYDVSGRLVRSLYRSQAENQVSVSILWDGCDDKGRQLSGGVYFIVLKSGKNSITEKVIMLK
jgi:hypothetical protein